MGMFDMLFCDAPLPLPEMQTRNFQTKDLDCALDQFRITADGTLLHYAREQCWVSEHDFHGDVYFYDFQDPQDTRNSPLIEFRARFTAGSRPVAFARTLRR